jgi:hypothetical protein
MKSTIRLEVFAGQSLDTHHSHLGLNNEEKYIIDSVRNRITGFGLCFFKIQFHFPFSVG